jgi:hypothetical protein
LLFRHVKKEIEYEVMAETLPRHYFIFDLISHRSGSELAYLFKR